MLAAADFSQILEGSDIRRTSDIFGYLDMDFSLLVAEHGVSAGFLDLFGLLYGRDVDVRGSCPDHLPVPRSERPL